MATPRGVRYNAAQGQSVDVQIFPEEFFSGSDVTVYFGDVWLDDLTGISFQMEEQIRPVFGYASYTWDTVMRGQRLITGQFSIAFREAGYLNNLVLDHIAQAGNAKPALAWMMDESRESGKSLVPRWQARARERVDELLARHHNPVKSVETKKRPQPYTWPSFNLATTNPGEKVLLELAQALARKGYFTMPVSGKPIPTDLWVPLAKFQREYFKMGPDDVQTPDGPILAVGPKTTLALSPEVEETVAVYQDKTLEGGAPNAAGQAKTRLARYEAEVWGLDSTYEGAATGPLSLRAMRRLRPHWYSGEYTKTLTQKGFDIYFSFGALDQYAAGKWGAGEYSRPTQATWGAPLKPTQDGVTFPTTVKALRNVQIQAVGMALDASGRPVEEIYRFLAQDLD